jgi:hypothetical protein
MPSLSRSSSAWPASMHSLRNTELTTIRAAVLGADQRPGSRGQTRAASPSKMDFDAVPLGLGELSLEPCCRLGSETEIYQCTQIDLFASFCRMVGDEGGRSGGSHWTQPRTGTQRGGWQHSSLK